jgi:hypothetical protein
MAKIEGGWGPTEEDFPHHPELEEFLDGAAGPRAEAPGPEGEPESLETREGVQGVTLEGRVAAEARRDRTSDIFDTEGPEH